jgi:hypothetical protein
MKKRPSHLVNLLLSAAVLYWALDLSASDRGLVDWVVIGLVGTAVLWNLWRLGARLHQAGGMKDVWHLARTLGFWTIGAFNTVLLAPEHAGSWRPIGGWIVFAIAFADTIAILLKERAFLRATQADPSRA